MEDIKLAVATRIHNKYLRGQAEHGGNLWDRPALPEVVNEITDLSTYVVTLEYQLRAMRDVVQVAQEYLDVDNLVGVREQLSILEGALASQLQPPVE